MSDLIANVFATSVLIFMLLVGLIKCRHIFGNAGGIEKFIVVAVFLLSLLVAIVSAFILIWI